ncbi:MAG: EscU/YscU/HrcU family type III secretion system export apparatus switch protein [Betaproteobacteria bacterium]|nr:EscU/YscU/HrcU family type III secretion system export apparatus switch protein [Betaproteobacteria bacterium]
MDDGQEFDRSQPATPYKLEKAREKGQVAKSADLAGAVVLLCAAAYLSWQGWQIALEQLRLSQTLIELAPRLSDNSELLTAGIRYLSASLQILGPMLFVITVAAVVSNLIQVGPLLSFEPIKPDPQRINPVSGFKRFLSMRLIYDALRASLKLTALALVGYFLIKGFLPEAREFAHRSAYSEAQSLIAALAGVGLKLSAALLVLALLDVLYTRYEFSKKMRMSHRDIKDEFKHREGDPRIRSRIRELRREMLKRSMSLKNTKGADVLLTNPTHFAVALRYVHGEMSAPLLIAKGAGQLAASMRDIAARHGVPVVQSPVLTRRLFKDVQLDQHIPPELFAEVARIIVWVLAMRDARKAAGSAV